MGLVEWPFFLAHTQETRRSASIDRLRMTSNMKEVQQQQNEIECIPKLLLRAMNVTANSFQIR